MFLYYARTMRVCMYTYAQLPGHQPDARADGGGEVRHGRVRRQDVRRRRLRRHRGDVSCAGRR